MRRRGVLVAFWLLFTGVATAVGLFAVAAIGNPLRADTDTLSEADLERFLQETPTAADSTGPTASASTPTSSGPPTSSPEGRAPGTAPPASPTAPLPPAASPPPASVSREIRTAGGAVLARCTGSQAYLTAWSPAQGWRVVDTEDRGPADEVSVEFQSATERIEVAVTCPGGQPASEVDTDPLDDDEDVDDGDDLDHDGP